MADAIDHQRLLAEIDEEVRRRRESGDLPADFERELDLVFSRFAPVHALGDDFDRVMERAEQLTFVDVLAPVESTHPVVPYVKRVVRKAIAWEVRHVAQQVSAFAATATRALRLLADRVDAAEGSPAARARALELCRAAAPAFDLERWAPVVVAAAHGATGRVLHAECGAGDLVATLAGAGVDAYGVDPRAQSPAPGREIRLDDARTHLRALPAGALGGVVLSGCVDWLSPPALVELADLATSRVGPGGVVIVVGTHPRAWTAPAADLAPGRPASPATWEHVLLAGGAAGAEVLDEDGPQYAVIARLPGAGAGAG